jgi:molybdopterin-guanine dinucleotide biosynthesis protein A
MAAASGYVLAGGRSTRMGRDKALLAWQGSTLLETALSKIAALGIECAILSGNPAYARYGRLVPDCAGYSGPLAGIEAALLDADNRLTMILPVDMPYLPTVLLQLMLERARETGAALTMPMQQGRAQPLVAVLSPAMLAPLTESIRQGAKAVYRTLVECAADSLDIFSVEHLEAVGQLELQQHSALFANLNAPEDWPINVPIP